MTLLLLLACNTNPAEEAEPAAIGEPTVEAPAPTTPEGEPLAVDVAGSTIGFVGSKVTKSHEGGFQAFDGKLFVKDDAPTGTVFTIDVGSVWTDSDKLTKHLKDEDFFHVEKYPEASFTSTAIRVMTHQGDAAMIEVQVQGMLDLRGTQKELTFPATIGVGEAQSTLKAEFSLNRKDWGIVYAGQADNLIEDLVLIKLDLVFPSPA